jgi:uncharacterized protein with NAD-binding domain and iron-sulfur cluster
MTAPATKQKIAILGGGIGALTAAFELTEQDPDGSRYDITIYTLGWRLGGKAASGRDADRDCRAYEHGLHVWAGFYDNAFDLVQRLYARLGEDEDAWGRFFEPLNHFTVAEYIDGVWKPWILTAQPNEFAPGLDGAPDLGPFTLLFGVLSGLASLLNFDVVPDPSRREIQAATGKAIGEVFPGRGLGDGESALTVLREFAEMRRQDPSRFTAEDAQTLIEACRIEAAAALNHENPDAARRLGILYDLGLALTKGLLSDGVMDGGLDAIDQCEWTDWMRAQDCPEDSLQSALVRGCYDYVFAFGADGKRNIGAGTATTALLRFLFTYKGSIFYTLRETMGDFLFAPLYDYLSGEKNVKFEFFCKIRSLTLAKDRPVLEEIVFDRQVLLADGTYDPLVDMPSVGRRTWPSGPKTAEIEDGDDLDGYDLESAWTDWIDAAPGRRLRLRGADDGAPYDDIFDIAILATSFGGLDATCSNLKARLPAWRKCLDGVKTIPTMALQLWLYPTTEHLGWPDPQTVLTALEEPSDVPPQFDSWEDNTRLLRLEAPREVDPQPRSLAYFAGEFPLAKDEPPRPYPQFPQQQDEIVRQIAVDLMNERLPGPGLWPKAKGGSGFDWDLLDAPDDASDEERLDSQYWRANINPWDRYVLSAPTTLECRMWPHGSGVENLYLAGDWVRSGLNAGCIEAAVIAGRMVARAITGTNIMVPGDGNPNDLPLPISALPLVNTLRKVKEHTAGGVGLMEGYFMAVTVPRTWVEKLLPPGLELMKTELDDDKKDLRPLVFLLTRQRNVRPGFVPFGGIHYQEFIEIVPRVRRKGLRSPAGGPFCYMPYLVLDEMLAVILGVNLYGFNKRFGRISSLGGSFDIHSDLGQARSWLTPSGLPGDRDTSGVDTICKLIEHPFISQRSTGDWVFSHFDLCLDTAEFQHIDGSLEVAPAFAGTDKPVAFGRPRKDQSPLWFHFSSHWTLSVPLDLHRSSRPVVSQDLQDFAARLRARAGPRGFFFP